MTHYETAIEEFVTSHELNGLAKATGPCITATVTIPDPAHLRPEINKTIRDLERRLKIAIPDVRTAQTLLEPLREFASTVETDGDWAVALVIYRSPDVFRCFRVPSVVKELATIEDNFEIRPLLPVVSREQRFHLLALSQKKVRLLDCSQYRTREVDLHGRVPQNMRVFLNGSMPDHVMSGTGVDREKHEQYLTHFFQEVDKGVHKILAGDDTPLLLAGVDYEVALYGRVTEYPRVMENAIHGSPDGVRTQQLHESALGIMRNSFSASLDKVMRELPTNQDAARVVFTLPDILDAAASGRVSSALVRENAEEPKINLALLQTLTHGGEAYALHDSEMPDHVDMAVVMRY